jgi:hypothetical protein
MVSLFFQQLILNKIWFPQVPQEMTEKSSSLEKFCWELYVKQLFPGEPRGAYYILRIFTMCLYSSK